MENKLLSSNNGKVYKDWIMINTMEKEQKLTSEEERELSRKYALETLGDEKIWQYALPKLVTKEQYGDMAQIIQGQYQKTIQQAPDQKTYEKVFSPLLNSEDGMLSNPIIQKNCAGILAGSVGGLYVEEILSSVGSNKKVKKEYEGKYVDELSEKERQFVVGMYMQELVKRQVSKALSKPSGEIAGGLEQILTDVKPEENALREAA